MLIRVPSRSIRTQDESFFKELLIDIIIKFTIRTIFVLSCDGSSTPVNELRGRKDDEPESRDDEEEERLRSCTRKKRSFLASFDLKIPGSIPRSYRTFELDSGS